MTSWTERFLSSHFLRAILVLVSGTALAQAIPVLFTPVISRLFSPDDMGVLGLFTSFISMTALAVGLSYPLAIVSDIPRRDSALLALLGLIVVVPMSTILAGVFGWMRFSQHLGFGELPWISIVWVWLCLVAIGAFSTFQYWLVREQQFGRISRATVRQSLGRTGSQLVVGFLTLGSGGLLFSEVVGRLAGVSELARLSWPSIREAASGVTRPELTRLAQDYRKFPLLSTPSSLINSLALALPAPLLVSAHGLSEAGQFTMAYRLLALPVAVVGVAVADVFHGQLARSASGGAAPVRRLFLRVTIGLAGIGILPSVAVMLWGPELFSIVLGVQWRDAGIIAAGIMPWLYLSFVVGPLSRVVLVFRGQELKLVYDVLAILGVILCIRLGASNDWSLAKTTMILGISQAAAYVVYFGLLWWIVTSRVTPSTAKVDAHDRDTLGIDADGALSDANRDLTDGS